MRKRVFWPLWVASNAGRPDIYLRLNQAEISNDLNSKFIACIRTNAPRKFRTYEQVAVAYSVLPINTFLPCL